MQAPQPQITAYRAGIAGALMMVAGILLSGPVGVILVMLTHPQPAWENAAVFAAQFHPVQTVPYFFGIFLVSGSLVLIAAIHRIAEEKHRIFTLIALLFAAIYATLVFSNYIVQTTFIPGLATRYAPEYEAAITMFTMSNPVSLAWAVELWGYGFLGLATWLVAPVFSGSGLERVTAWLLIANGIISVITAALTPVFPGWALTSTGLWSVMIWNALMLAIGILVVKVFIKRMTATAA